MSSQKPERRNRFDKQVDIEVTVSDIEEKIKTSKPPVKQITDEQPEEKEESPKETPEQVTTTTKTTIKEGMVETETEILKQTTLASLTNLKSNELVSKIVRRSKEKDELAEILDVFPNMTKNKIVSAFVEEIQKQREKEIRRKMMGFKNKKAKSFKESKDTFSMPVRPEMKELLKVISLFSGSNKYLFFEDFILRACQLFDFDAVFEEFEE